LPSLQYIDTLEQALALPRDAQPEWVLFEVTGDLLWDAWLAHGRKLGNQEQRLLGADDDWYFPATEALETDPLRARALFTVLSAHGSTPERRELAHEYLVSLLAALPRGEQLVRGCTWTPALRGQRPAARGDPLSTDRRGAGGR
jgi:hypothetical protein